MILMLGAIIGTYSRAALLAALAAMGCVLCLESSQKLPVAFAAAICIAGVSSFMLQKWFDKMDALNPCGEDKSASGRFDDYILSISVVNDKVWGGGFKVNIRDDLCPIYNLESPALRAPHSIYFDASGGQGHIGLAIV